MPITGGPVGEKCCVAPPPWVSVRYFGTMKSLATLPIFLFTVPALAQITLGPADMPSPGDTVRYVTTTTTIDPASTGAAHWWDFSALVAGPESADTMVTVGSTPLAYQFFFNNALLYPNHKADFAMRGPAVGMQGFSLSNVFDYYKNNASGFRNVGFGANLNGLPTSVRRDPVDWIYRFPLQFGNVDSSASHFEVSVPTMGFFGQDQVRRNEVDGWGTLVLPTDTFQVLRVRSRISRTDTVYISMLSMGFAVPEPETIEYKWIAAGMDQPVLQVTTVGGVNTVVRFHYDPADITTQVEPHGTKEQLRLWPNPVSDRLFWDGKMAGSVLVASDGSVVLSFPQGPTSGGSIGVGHLAPGQYFVRDKTGRSVQGVMIAR